MLYSQSHNFLDEFVYVFYTCKEGSFCYSGREDVFLSQEESHQETARLPVLGFTSYLLWIDIPPSGRTFETPTEECANVITTVILAALSHCLSPLLQ